MEFVSPGDDVPSGGKRRPDPVDATAAAPEERFRTLPQPIRLADTVTSVDTVVHPGPGLERDPERDFMLRYGMP